MDLQEFLLNRFQSWVPTAPDVLSRTKRDITLSWKQKEFAFLEHDLIYRVEKNNKLPKWLLVYSGGKTTKRIDDLAPSHPHKFRLKIILKATAVQHIVKKALEYFGDENTIYKELGENIENTCDNDGENENGAMKIGGGDSMGNIVVTVEDTSKVDGECDNNAGTGDKMDDKRTVIEINASKINNSKDRCTEKPKWIESQYSELTWTSTNTEGTSAVCFCMAVKCGYLKEVQSMLEERPELLGIVNASNGFTPLATAVRKGDINTTKFLVSLGAELDHPSSAGQTPLHLAVLAANVPIAEHLIARGADFQARDWNGLRVEHFAVDSGSLEMLQLILDRGGDVKAKDYNGWTPLFRALCQGARTEMVQELVLRGSDINAVDNAGLPMVSAAKLLKNRHGRGRDSILRLVDSQYPHGKALANFTRLSRKVYNVNTLFKLT